MQKQFLQESLLKLSDEIRSDVAHIIRIADSAVIGSK